MRKALFLVTSLAAVAFHSISTIRKFNNGQRAKRPANTRQSREQQHEGYWTQEDYGANEITSMARRLTTGGLS